MALRPLSAGGFFSDPMFVGTRRRILLGSSVSPTEDVFAALGYLSEVKKVGRELLVRIGHPKSDIDSTYLLFRSFIRQARTFFESARTLHHRASALIYYYSFLNLAKAYICLTDPQVVSGKIPHGLFYRFRQGKLSAQFLGVEGQGVYRTFYEKVSGVRLPRHFRPNVGQLLTYCSDIAYECETSGFGHHRALPCWHRMIFDPTGSKTAFSLLAIAHFDRIEPYKKALSPFFNYYEEVDVSSNISLVAKFFELSHPVTRSLRYFESKKHYPLDSTGSIRMVIVTPEINNALRPFYLTNPFNSEHQFFMTVPWNRSQQIPFNEILAIYSFMFYLGSLVRYHPAYLERIIESADSWIIERFVNSCTTTFLRHMGCLISQTDNVYFPR